MDANNHSEPIVVGVDGSEPSTRALLWAAREATLHAAPLDVVHAWTTPSLSLFTFDERARFEQGARATLDHAVSALASTSPVPEIVHPRLIEDSTVPALLRVAEDAALLVIGSRGHGGFAGLLLGSVSQQCSLHATRPVAVVPPSWEATEDGRVVVGVDGSEPSFGALRWAIDEAVRRAGTLVVVNAYEYPALATPIGPLIDADPDDLAAASRSLLDESVAQALGSAPAQPRAVELVPVRATPARGLLECAQDAGVLVVGSRGRGGFGGLLLGSVSQQCIHHASCPVVVVHTG